MMVWFAKRFGGLEVAIFGGGGLVRCGSRQ